MSGRGGYTGRGGRDDRDGGGNRGGGRGDRGGGGGYRGDRGGGGGGFRGDRGGGGGGGYRGGGGRGDRGGSAPVMTAIGSVNFLTNHFSVNFTGDLLFTSYHVDVQFPEGDTTRLIRDRRSLVVEKAILKENNREKMLMFYDGDHLLATLASEKIKQGTFTVDMGPKKYEVRILLTKENLSLSSILDSNSNSPEVREAISDKVQLLDIVFSQAACQHSERPSARLYLLKPKEGKEEKTILDLEKQGLRGRDAEGKSLWMGHCQSLQRSNYFDSVSNSFRPQLTLVLNAAASVAYDKMHLCLWTRKKANFDPCDLRDVGRIQQEFQAMTKGLEFGCSHLPGRRFKIVDISNKTALTHSFEYEGRMTTVNDYFKMKYDITLKYPNAPLIQLSPKRRDLFTPAELMYICRQRLMGKVTETIKGCVGTIMTMEPGKRKSYIDDVLRDNFGSNDVLKTLSIDLSREFLECKGEVIAAPTVRYCRRSAAINQGKWNMTNCQFNDGKSVNYYGIISFAGAGVQNQILEFFRRLAGQAKDLGMDFKRQDPVWKGSYDSEDDIPAIAERMRSFAAESKVLDVLFIVLKEKSSRVYKPLKEALDGLVVTQCLVAKNTPIINNKDRGVEGHIANILCKVNMKLGGTNQVLDHEKSVDKALKDIVGTDGRTCVVGVDLNHPSAAAAPRGQDRSAIPSFAAMVASVDGDCCKFTHVATAQPGGQDTIKKGDVSMMFSKLMETRGKFLKNEKSLWPNKIVYLRDGTNEEALKALIEQEIDDLMMAYKAEKQEKPKVLAVVVKKRHQTRFFPKEANCDSRMNMPPGTLLLDNLSLPLQFENFYLLSHAGIKGTSHPCRYVVVKDEFTESIPFVANLNTKDRLKKYANLMYQFCHLYGRCQRSVSVPAPLFYANLFAERMRIHGDQLCRKHIGMGAVDSCSEPFGDREAGLPVDSDSISTLFRELDEKLSSVSGATKPFFFC